MVETLSVSISGSTLSWLLYENVRSEYDQEGFLLGDIIEMKTNSITDNEEQVTKVDRIIKVSVVLPFPRQGYFYDAAGQIDTDKIDNFLGNPQSNQTKVVAWYKYKHSNAFKMTIREKIVHKRLCQHFGPSNPELFACCLLTTDSSQNNSTHLYSQTFLRYIEPTYQMIPMHIANLSDPNDSYRSAQSQSRHFSDLVKSLKIDTEKSPGVNVAMQINEKLQSSSETIVTELAEAQKKFFDLEVEVRRLQEKLKQKQMLKNAKTMEEMVENGDSEDLLDSASVQGVCEK